MADHQQQQQATRCEWREDHTRDIESMSAQLKSAVKALQTQHVKQPTCLIYSDTDTNSLCYAIEAIFLHGLKGAKPTKPNKWCFWQFLLGYTHTSILSQIDSLTQITTDIGRCRAWIRMALNGGDLESYFCLISADTEQLEKYYEHWAFLRDIERSTFLTTIVQGLERIKFCLSYKSSLLNLWTGNGPQLAGLIHSTPPTPVAADVIGSATIPEEKMVEVLAERDPSFDDFDLGTDERQEISEMFHHCSTSPPSSAIIEATSNSNTAAITSVTDIKDCKFVNTQILTPSKCHKSKSVDSEQQPRPVSAQSRRRRGDSLTLYRAALTNAQRAVLASRNESGKRQQQQQQVSSTTASSAAAARMEADRETVEQLLQRSISSPGLTSSSRPPVKATGRSKVKSVATRPPRRDKYNCDSGCSSFQSDSVLSLSQDSSSSSLPLANARTSLPVIEASDESGNESGNVSSASSSSAESDDDNTLELESYAEILRQYRKHPFVFTATSHSIAVSNRSDCGDQDRSFEHSQQPSTDETVCVDSDEWIVIDRSDEEFIAKPFHVDESTAGMMSFVNIRMAENWPENQGYRCHACRCHLSSSTNRQCCFNGRYYCTDCHIDNKSAIPSRIMFDWDFVAYPVSQESLKFLQKVHDWPMLNVNELNPRLYDCIRNLNTARSKRTQIVHLVRYMLACSSAECDQFWRMMSTNWHVFQHVHHYSMKELEAVKDGSYLMELQRIVAFGVQHVTTCRQCAPRGFVCEICSVESDVLYPFDISRTNTCERCHNVYHKSCWSADRPCVRCVRRCERRRHSSCNSVELVLFSHPDDMKT